MYKVVQIHTERKITSKGSLDIQTKNVNTYYKC